MALLLITHDLGIVRKMANRTCVMKDGEVVERGPGEEVSPRPSIPTPSGCWKRSQRASRRKSI